jgi:hypothetical protein
MSTLGESTVANSSSTKVWVMDPSLFDVNMTHYCLVMVDKKYRWMTPKWSPYGEIPHRKTLCGLSYPRSMVRETMLIFGIMR